MKRIVRLNERELRSLIRESAIRVLNEETNELSWQTYANAARKWSDHLKKNPNDPRRKSSIMGHEDSHGTHDIDTDDRLRGFKNAAENAFNRDFGYEGDDGRYGMDMSNSNIGHNGYYDSLITRTTARSGNKQHHLKDTFHLDSLDGKDKYPRGNHEAHASHINGEWQRGPLGGTEIANAHVDRDAVEPQYDDSDFGYMKARNKGNQSIMDYQSGKSKYVKGQGWTNNNFSVVSCNSPEAGEELYGIYFHGSLEDEIGYDIVSQSQDNNMTADEIESKTKAAMRNGEDYFITPVTVDGIDEPCSLVAKYDIYAKHHQLCGLIVKDDEIEDAKEAVDRELSF